jgi:GNAT superfamily N-acetyltransferase
MPQELPPMGAIDHVLLRLMRVSDKLPGGFDAMRQEARSEGYRFLDRLVGDWDAGTLRFDRPGEMLLAGEANGMLAAIGGLTEDPAVADAFRMRRFYVRLEFRRGGVGRRLAAALLDPALRSGRPVMVNAASGSGPFWESLGFAPDPRDGHTHVLIADRTSNAGVVPIGRAS